MKVVHITAGGPFTEECGYQENMLATLCSDLGHEVTIIARTDRWSNGIIEYVEPCNRELSNGVRLIRLPLRFCRIKGLAYRLVKMVGLINALRRIRPDRIMVHGMGNFAMVDACIYKEHYDKQCVILADSHVDDLNSGRNWLSNNVLHGILYKYNLRIVKQTVDRFIATSDRAKQFCVNHYGLEPSLIEVWPLGGILASRIEIRESRQSIRKAFRIPDEAVLFIHTGKLSREKRTSTILEAMSEVTSPDIRLIIAGSAPDDVRAEIELKCEIDKRVLFCGWVNSNELVRLFQASDVYLQPGTGSASFQEALCSGCAAIADLRQGYDSGFASIVSHAVSAKEFACEMNAMRDSSYLNSAKQRVREFAYENLDYNQQVLQIIYGLKHEDK